MVEPARGPEDLPAMEPASVTETHISVLFSYGDKVVKVRKPVRFGFLDFTDLAARARDCEREVTLNRRLAPDVYLGTAELHMGGRTVEHAVVMRRLPTERNLARLAESGTGLDPELRDVARVLARFHAGADRSPAISAAASADALRRRWEADVAEVAPFVGSLVEPELHRRTVDLARGYVAGRAELFDERIAEGRVCDGHGDLQAADVFCLDDGPRILDCLEFDDRLRHGDVLADLAFLAMDLERLGRPEAAARLLEDYREESGTSFPPSLAHFYVASRAHVRMLVACLRAEQATDDGTGAVEPLLRLAHRHLRHGQVQLVLVGGSPGTGKSTVAGGLAALPGTVVLSTDEVRRQRTRGPGPDDADLLTGDRYSPAAREAVYDAVLEQAGRHLRRGRSVVLDGSWSEAAMRRRASTLADDTWSNLVEIRCWCPETVARDRVVSRLREGGDASEATAEVAEAMARSFEPWPSAELLDTSGPLGAAVERARSVVEASG